MGLIVFRADANPTVGMGHLMRCLSIADVAKDNGIEVCFILADDGASAIVESRGFSFIALNSDYRKMVEELLLWPADLNPSAIVIDSYYVTEDYFTSIKTVYSQSKLLYIDDLVETTYDVDMILNYNAFAKSFAYENLYKKEKKICPKLIIGPKYVPLRKMFSNISPRKQPQFVKNILISTGGADSLHVSLNIIRYMKGCKFKSDIIFHFLIGAMNEDKKNIISESKEIDNICLHENVSDMKSLIESCDIVISASGTTLYEVCACGVPLITYVEADNQKMVAESFEAMGIAKNVGDIRHNNTTDDEKMFGGEIKSNAAELIVEALSSLIDDYKYRCIMSSRMQSVVDCLGAERIVEEIL